MTYEIRDQGDGRFELVHSLGVLTNRRIAEILAGYLESLDEIEQRQLDIFSPAASPMPVSTSTAPTKPVSTGPADKKPAAAKSKPASSPDAAIMETALQRIAAGEKVSEVAKNLGLNFGSLRATWANRSRKDRPEVELAYQAPTEASAATPEAPGTDLEQEDCRLCGRPFRATVESDGLCARCNRDH